NPGGSGVAGYKVFRNGVPVGTTSSNSYSDQGLTPSTLYTYTVLAYDGTTPPNNSAQSPSVSVNTTGDVPTPTPTPTPTPAPSPTPTPTPSPSRCCNGDCRIITCAECAPTIQCTNSGWSCQVASSGTQCSNGACDGLGNCIVS